MSGKSIEDIEKEEEARMARMLNRKTPRAVFKKPKDEPAKPQVEKKKADTGVEPEWKRRQREIAAEREEQAKQEAAKLQARLSRVGKGSTSEISKVETRSSETSREVQGIGGRETSTARAEGEEKRLASTLGSRFKGSVVERRMKMQEKQEKMIAALEAAGGPAKFDRTVFEKELLKEINEARTRPKFYVKGLMKLKKGYASKDLIPPSRPTVVIATSEGVKGVTNAILFMSGSARKREPLEQVHPDLSKICDDVALRWADDGSLPNDDDLARVNEATPSTTDVSIVAYDNGGDVASELIAMWLVNDGDDDRKLRMALLDPRWRALGVGTAINDKKQRITVLAFASEMAERDLEAEAAAQKAKEEAEAAEQARKADEKARAKRLAALAEAKENAKEESGGFLASMKNKITDAVETVKDKVAGDDGDDAAADAAGEATKAVEEATEKESGGFLSSMKDKVTGAVESVKDKLDGSDDEDAAGDALKDAADKLKDTADDAADEADDAKEESGGFLSSMKDKITDALGGDDDEADADDAKDAIKGAAGDAADAAEDAAEDAKKESGGFLSSMKDKVTDALGGGSDDAKDAVEDAADAAEDAAGDAKKESGGFLSSMKDKVAGALGGDSDDDAKDAVKDAAEDATDAAEDAAKDAKKESGGFLSSMKDKVAGALGGDSDDDAKDAAKDAAEDATDAAEDAAEGAKEASGGFFASMKDKVTDAVDAVKEKVGAGEEDDEATEEGDDGAVKTQKSSKKESKKEDKKSKKSSKKDKKSSVAAAVESASGTVAEKVSKAKDAVKSKVSSSSSSSKKSDKKSSKKSDKKSSSSSTADKKIEKKIEKKSSKSLKKESSKKSSKKSSRKVGDEAMLMSFANSPMKQKNPQGGESEAEEHPAVVAAREALAATTQAPSETAALQETEDGNAFFIEMDMRGECRSPKLFLSGETLKLVYADGATKCEHRLSLPFAFEAEQMSAELSPSGDSLRIEMLKSQSSSSDTHQSAVDGHVCEFETTGVDSLDCDSIQVEVNQNATHVLVDILPSRSDETVQVVFRSPELEVSAQRVVVVHDAQGRARMKKTVVENIRIPFRPQSITTESHGTGKGRKILIEKPAVRVSRVAPKPVQIKISKKK